MLKAQTVRNDKKHLNRRQVKVNDKMDLFQEDCAQDSICATRIVVCPPIYVAVSLRDGHNKLHPAPREPGAWH